MVLLGFITAGYLISKSYLDWQSTPISTTISTHPLAELDFPTVTVCPPKDSHTALNYDLMKAGNDSLTEEHREHLKKTVFESFIETPNHQYMRRMKESPMDPIQIYEGFQSVPKPYGDSGFEIVTWNNYGRLETPRFGEQFESEYYKTDKWFHIVLEFPDNLGELLGSESLVIEVETDTREEEDWMEEVTYMEGTKYKMHDYQLSWTDAEFQCAIEGGHLASVQSVWEQGQLEIDHGPKIFYDSSSSDEYEQIGLWIGGRYQEDQGVWNWSDGTPWSYTNWEDGERNARDGGHCAMVHNGEWEGRDCSNKLRFICQLDPSQLHEGKNLTLEYTHSYLFSPYFQLWYRYKAVSQEVLDSWEDKRITGFRLSWRIDKRYPDLELTTSEVGQTVQTPGLGDSWDGEFYKDSHTYTCTLLFPGNLAELVGDGSLVIEVEVDTREEAGWEEYVETNVGEVRNYKFYDIKLTWPEAEAYCQSEQGHLASVLTEEEQQKVDRLSGGNITWIGGTNGGQSKDWQWTDGSASNYTNWDWGLDLEEYTTYGVGNQVNSWRVWDIVDLNPFICVFKSSQLLGKTKQTLEFTRQQLTFPFFQVQYRYQFTSQDLLNSWQDKRMTGFDLNWFIKDINGTEHGNITASESTKWKPIAATPKYKEPFLANMVNQVIQARIQNVTNEEIIFEKERIALQTNNRETCIKLETNQLFHIMNTDVQNFNKVTTIIEEDVMAGLELFLISFHCSESTDIYKFLHNLISTQSPRTIIQTTVNTIQSDNIKERGSRITLGQFYMQLDKIFQFQLGNILSAMLPLSEIETMKDKDWPYFTHYQTAMDMCLNEHNCQMLTNITKDLGKLYLIE